ncbi:hypothetical protein [Bradyrhizobium tropiciagri]|uniref:hypothetical protein n=1 Tax=Bradyrhizobium tropiciagri TaxID=312253 RepID=UPI00067D6562|nr:hypothetical protein [Bradyrhizobium tropiciagri]
MTEIVTRTTEPEHQLSVAKVMTTALAPFKLMQNWRRIDLLNETVERRLTRIDDDGELIALRTTDKAKRWEMNCEAYNLQEAMPPMAEIVAAHKAVDRAIETLPTYRERKLLAGLMLDGLGIKPEEGTAAYAEALAWTLENVAPGQGEERAVEYIPAPAIAAAIDWLWRNYGETYGRPPPIHTVLEQCVRFREKLDDVRDRIFAYGQAHRRLGQIIEATDGDIPDDDGDVPF